MQPVTFTPEIAARLGLRSGAPTFGRLQCFDATPGASVRTNVWDRFATFGEGPDGVKVKDGDEVNFTPAKFKEAVENWYRRGGRLPMCLDHRSALGGYVEAQAAAKYDAMAVVSGGQISHFRKLATSSATPPDVSALKGHAMKFATEFNPDPAPDGLWGFRCEITPKGAHPTEGLANYEGISPFFVMDGTDEQERPVGMVIFDVAAVNANFQAGCELTMGLLNSAPTDGAKVHAMGWNEDRAARDAAEKQRGEKVRVRCDECGRELNGFADGSLPDHVNAAGILCGGTHGRVMSQLSADPSGNGATTMASVEGVWEKSTSGDWLVKVRNSQNPQAGDSVLVKSKGGSTNWRRLIGKQEDWGPNDVSVWTVENGPSSMSATGAARRMGVKMDENQMAAHFNWAPEDDDKAKLAKVCAKMAMPEPPAVMAADPEADAKKKDDDEAAVEMGRLLGSTTPVTMRAAVTHIAAGKLVPASDVATLRASVQTMSAQIAASRDEKIAEIATAHVTAQIKDGCAPDKPETHAALIRAFSVAMSAADKPGTDRAVVMKAGVDAIEPFLSPKGTHTLGVRMTAGGDPIGKPREQPTDLGGDDADAIEARVTSEARKLMAADAAKAVTEKRQPITFSVASGLVLAADRQLNAQYRAIRR